MNNKTWYFSLLSTKIHYQPSFSRFRHIYLLTIVIIFFLYRTSLGLHHSRYSNRLLSSRYCGASIQMPRRPANVATAKLAASRPNSDYTKKADDDYNDDPDVKLFSDWIHHSDLSFHSFDSIAADNIRSSLLTWYRQNRRKLPWRGDPPPYDGSTAGINANQNSKKTLSSTSIPKITSFFQSTKDKKSSTTASTATATPDSPSSTMTTNTTITNSESIPISAYGIWVSEIMLQQTRVEAVIPYWIRWMTTFPTVYELAAATEEQVNSHWAGLGFYRRARLLHQGAQLVVNEYQGQLPKTVDGLLKITGIGPYTASAIASIAYGTCVPVVDGNVCRVLSRLTGIANHIKAPALKDKQGWDLAAQLVHGSNCAGEINQALMELGATYCAPSGTGIDPRDPLKDYYFSTRIAKAYHTLQNSSTKEPFPFSIPDSCSCPVCDSNGIRMILQQLQTRIQKEMTVDEARKEGHAIFPLDPPKTKKREEDLAVAVLSNHHDGDIWWLLVRRPPEGLLAGQWEFPSVCIESRQEGGSNSMKPTLTKRRKLLTQHLQTIVTNGDPDGEMTNCKRHVVQSDPIEHIFSHVRHIMWLEAAVLNVNLTVMQWMTTDGREVRWMRDKEMKTVGITSGVKKILKTVQLQQGSQSGTVTTPKKRKR